MANEFAYKKNSIFSIPLRLLLGINMIIAFPMLCVNYHYAQALKKVQEAGAAAPEPLKEDLHRYTQIFDISLITTVIIGGLTVILLLCWARRAAANLWAWKIKGVSQKPIWATLNVIIPFYNLYKPFFFMKELWNATAGTQEDSTWKNNKAPWHLSLLWCLILIAIILFAAISSINQFHPELLSENILHTASEVLTFISIINAAMLISFVTGVENKQAEYLERIQLKESGKEKE